MRKFSNFPDLKFGDTETLRIEYKLALKNKEPPHKQHLDIQHCFRIIVQLAI